MNTKSIQVFDGDGEDPRPCPVCDGAGYFPKISGNNCKRCNGTGKFIPLDPEQEAEAELVIKQLNDAIKQATGTDIMGGTVKDFLEELADD